jgi:hypothetical protein
MTALSYAIAATPVNQAASSLTVPAPPAYQAGDLLVMGVTGTAPAAGTGVAANTPSGWTSLSAGAGLSFFYKTAGAEPASYTVTMASSCAVAAYTAAFPAATISSHTFGNSGSGALSYAPSFPGGITSGQTVLVAGAAVTSSGSVNTPVGNSNFNFPPGALAEVPAFAPAQPNAGPYTGAAGLCSIPGSAASGTAPLTSGQQCTFYAGFIVLTVTGTGNPLSVTATAGYPEGTPGLALTVKALSGAASPAAIAAGGATRAFYASGTSQAPAAAITPNASGSLVYGALTENVGVTGGTSYTANAATAFSQNVPDAAWSAIYGTLRSASATTAGTPVTAGGSAPANAYTTAALAEILAASGSSLSETATATAAGTVPGNFATAAVAQTAVFPSAPAAGTLLVAMVSANSSWGNGNAAVTISDSSGLTWVPLAQVTYPSYSGVWVAAVGAPASSYVIEDEGGNPVLDEGGNQVYDESGPGSTSPFPQPGRAVAGKARARKGASAGSPGAPYVFVPVVPAVFRQPNRAVPAHPAARKGAGTAGNPGAAYVYVPVIPAPFAQPGQAPPAHPAARRGTVLGSPGAPYVPVSPYPAYVIEDEAGGAVLDEAGGFVYDESGPGPLPGSPAWSAARAGLTGDESAVNWASQVSQFLVSHGVTPVYSGNRVWTVAVPSAPVTTAFGWLDGTTAGWLPAADVSQPFALPAGVTAIGRVQVPVQASGNGADLQVTLCPDNGSGSPALGSPLASVTVPASHIDALSASGSLAAAGPLATSRYNAGHLGPVGTGPWAQPAVSANGAGSYATPVTSGGFTALIGGYDSLANAAIGYVAVIASQGTSVSGGATQPALPQATRYACAAITTDSVVVAGGQSTTAQFATVWTAPWDAGTGTIGSWSAQQALPNAVVYGAMASWGTTVYVIGGTPTGFASGATSAVWTASAASGQVTAWTAGPPLPVKLVQAYAAVIGNWLVVAGGQNTSGTALNATWYSAVNPDGSLAGWQQGPALPQAVYAFGPGWNTVVTDSAVAIVSGSVTLAPTFSPYTQVLAVSPDGPADMWQLQNWSGTVYGVFQCGASPGALPGEWQVYCLHLAGFDTATMYPVPLLSVPLPASGLTPGAGYHLVFHQAGGSATDGLQLGVMTSGPGTGWLHAARGSVGPWSPVLGQQVAVNVFDQTPGGSPLHLVQDSGAGVTTLAWSGSGSGLLNGVLESAVFPPGSPVAALPSVVQVTYGAGGIPSGLVQLT